MKRFEIKSYQNGIITNKQTDTGECGTCAMMTTIVSVVKDCVRANAFASFGVAVLRMMCPRSFESVYVRVKT